MTRTTWSSARVPSTCNSSTRRRSSRSCSPSATPATPSSPATTTVASRRCWPSRTSALTWWCPARTRSSPPRSSGPGTLGLQYLLLDPALGEVIDTGRAEDAGGGDFTVTIPAEVTDLLFPGGFYQLYLAADSDSLALITERRVDLEVLP